MFMEKMSGVVEGVLGTLYPAECPVCSKVMTRAGGSRMKAHPSCYRRLKRIVSPMCKRCGKPLLSEQQEYCYDCVRQHRSFESGHGLWLYDKLSSASIFSFKYGGKREYAHFYAQAIVHFYGEWISRLQVQQLVPVPVSRQKRRQRGYNQAELLADDIGAALHIPVNSKGLLRIHSTAPQKELGKEERCKNLEKAFQADVSRFKGIQKVLLVDDIYTTGSTVEYCSRALKKAGVRQVWFITVCIGGIF